MSYQYLLEKTLRNKTILPKFDRDKIELNFGGCKMQYIPKEFDGYAFKYRITLVVKDSNSNYIREADFLINDFWEVVKLVDEKYYNSNFENYARDRARKLIENYYYYTYNFLDFIYSYEENGEKFVEIADEGVLSSKDNNIKFTFKDGMKIDMNDYDFDYIYDGIQLREQRYTVQKMSQIILNNTPMRKDKALFYKEIKVFRHQHWCDDYYLEVVDNNRNTLCYIKDKTIINHFDYMLNSLEDSTIKLMEEEVDKKFKELGW